MGNDLKCGQCNECRNDPLLSYMSEETRDNPYPKHSFDSYSRLTRIQREELLRDIEKLYLREFDNAVDRKKNAKPAILQEQETVGDVLRENRKDEIGRQAAGNTGASRTLTIGGGSEFGGLGGLFNGMLKAPSVSDKENIGKKDTGSVKGGSAVKRQQRIPNVGDYTGEMYEDKPHGKGRMEYINRDVYEGNENR